MADVLKLLGETTVSTRPRIRYKDMGDGSYAEVIATAGSGAGGVTTVSGPNTKVVRITPTVSATPDYSIDDVLGGKMTVLNIARANGTGGIINSVIMTSKVDIPVGVTVDVLFFDTDPTNSTFTDNAGLSVNVADLAFLLPGFAQLTTRIDLGTGAALSAQNLGLPIDTLTTDDLWAVAVVRGGALNLASTTDIQFVFGFLPD